MVMYLFSSLQFVSVLFRAILVAFAQQPARDGEWAGVSDCFYLMKEKAERQKVV